MNKEELDKEFKNVIRKLVLLFVGAGLSIALGVLVMIKGWGLEPVSWWWILGVGVVGRLAAELLYYLGK